jgi:DNA polymerase III subunit delta'
MPLKDIRGQDRVVESIKRSLASDRFPHAWLFLGPPGSGRHKTAIEFARLLNCDLSPVDNCGKCPSCVMIGKKAHPDVVFIAKEAGKKNISIDSIRALKIKFSLKPFQGRFNIAVIDAQDMAEESASSILKILEEPPLNTVFILIASARQVLFDTIVSRCQIVTFKALSQADTSRILIEDFYINEKEAMFLSCLSGCNVKKALILRDEGAMSWKNRVIDIFSTGSTPYSGQGPPAEDAGFTNEQACDILAGFYRDVLVYKHTNMNDLLINADRCQDIAAISEKVDSLRIQTQIGYIEEAKNAFRSNANTRLTFNLLKERLMA